MEVENARAAELFGADILMEISTGGDFREIRRHVIEATSLNVGSVPLYQAFIEAIRKYGAGVDMPEDDLLRVTEEQSKMGTNFMAIHTGINVICVERLKRQGGRFGVLSYLPLESWIAGSTHEIRGKFILRPPLLNILSNAIPFLPAFCMGAMRNHSRLVTEFHFLSAT